MPPESKSSLSESLQNSGDAALRVEGLLASYDSLRTYVQQRLHNLDGVAPAVFLGIAYRHLTLDAPVSRNGARFVAEMLVGHEDLAELLADPRALLRDEALLVLRAVTVASPGLESALLERSLAGGQDERQLPGLFRVLELTSSVDAVGRTNMQLTRLLRHSNPRVRAKTAQLLLGSTGGAAVAVQLMEDPDPRVRANVIEGLWPQATSAHAQRIFRANLGSPVVRVSTNALVGLGIGGDPEVYGLLVGRLRGGNAELARAAAWAMGHLRDLRFREPLADALRGGNLAIRGAVLRAMVKLNQKTAADGGDDGRSRDKQGEVIEMLRQGVAGWNAWRKESGAVQPRLDGADLRGAMLMGADFRYCSLQNADLREARLNLSSLYGADLSGANFTAAQLDRADLRACETDGFTDFSEASLQGADLFGLDLRGVLLRGARMEGANREGTLFDPPHQERGIA